MKLTNIIIIICFIFALPIGGMLCIIPITSQTKSSSEINDSNIKENIKPSQFAERTIRVAIYNEPNTTLPSYATGTTSLLNNDYLAVKTLLEGAGYQVSELTVVDISAHKLKTANYDVFIMADNIPRENITNFVMEFWLGGGGILSLDSAICYICYAGMIPPESVGSHGYLTYWSYLVSTTFNITLRHPVTKAYQVNDTFSEVSKGWASFYWNILQSSSIASEIVKLATIENQPNNAPVVGLDPSKRGGRVIQIPSQGLIVGPNMDNLIIDAVDWLCPHPKGRILFDISHLNGYGIDSWDNPYVKYLVSYYSILRDALVSRMYTIDKLYPSSLGNLTTTNLAPYDLLIVNFPFTNFTASEVVTVTKWIKNGGGILALGNYHTQDGSINLNYLLSSLDLSLISDESGATMSFSIEHPTEEGCSELYITGSSQVSYSGNAYPLWGLSLSDIRIAGQEYGNGRVILSGDLDMFSDTFIGASDNLQYAINVVNWLTACEANVLLMVTENHSPNYYKTPVVQALNDLGISFYLTFQEDYFNLSLNLYDWTLIIVDAPSAPLPSSFFGNLIKYVDAGGRLIYSSYTVSDTVNNRFWDYLGFEYAADIFTGDPVYIWDPTHSIFNTPAFYDANNFTSTNYWADDGDRLTVYPNATALAGYTSTESADNAIIVLRNDRKTLYNGYLIDEFTGDTNDDTYQDNYELWLNEIAFIMPPSSAAPSGDGDDGGKGKVSEYPWLLLMIIIGAIIGLIAIVAIVLILKKKR